MTARRRASFRFSAPELASYSDAFLRALAGAPANATVERAELAEVRYGLREAQAVVAWSDQGEKVPSGPEKASCVPATSPAVSPEASPKGRFGNGAGREDVLGATRAA